ncbi:MAG: WYL domain-containing protein [Oscillospiraceae bacterium]|nr:WYL domain-containing protein [Oscillospiraceae bacterium]
MARSSNQKLKLLYVMQFLTQNTDAEHPAPAGRIIDYLESQGIQAERKSIYDDIEALRLFGLDVEQNISKRDGGYYVASRNFELPELKLLVDSVQSSKFITHQKTTTLIKKIEKLSSVYEAQLLQRQVYVANRIKTMNESIYYNVDAIHTGISRNRRIRFKYFEYTVTKERKYRRDGAYYVISPFSLTWDNENYYMIGFDSEAGMIKHFRVDKMTHISTTEQPRDGMDVYKGMDMAVYVRKVFGMFSGSEETVRLRFAEHLVGAVLDRLGQEVSIVPDGEGFFTVTAQVVVSPQFFAWVSGFGDEAKIIAPAQVVDQMREHSRKVAAQYE